MTRKEHAEELVRSCFSNLMAEYIIDAIEDDDRKHGYWKPTNKDKNIKRCSNCGCKIDIRKTHYFCPGCGSRNEVE